MDHEELVRRYSRSYEDLSDEERVERDAANRYRQEKIERGEVLKSWSKENFPLGLDENMDPFPLTGPDQDQAGPHENR